MKTTPFVNICAEPGGNKHVKGILAYDLITRMSTHFLDMKHIVGSHSKYSCNVALPVYVADMQNDN
jgi:hypothetical protein